MAKSFSYLYGLLIAFPLKAQHTVLSRVSATNSSIVNIKWYFPDIISRDGFNVYRKEVGDSNWGKISPIPVKCKAYTIPESAFTNDKELKNYLALIENPTNIKDLALFAILIKSFKSEAFSKYLGIWLDDSIPQKEKEYVYKVTILNKGEERDLAVSEKISAGKYSPASPPKNIVFKMGNKKVSFKWEPEPDRYFGVNIYRKSNDTDALLKITRDPIILSKTRDKNGAETYGNAFFVDQKLKSGVKYYYVFEAIDFFGSPSVKSDPMEVLLKDMDPPRFPDSIYFKLEGRKVSLKWKKKKKEEDLAGYNIYRTNKSDTDYLKVNQKLIPFKDSLYLDSIVRFGSYMYSISSVDKDGNESVSNPYFIEVYDKEPPAKPKNLIILPDSGCLTLKWTKNTEDDIKGYLIYRTINKNSEGTYVKITPTFVKENYYVDRLSKNIKNKFLYKIVAIDESMNKSPYSDFAVARMPDAQAPSPPFLKTIYVNEKKHILIEWFPNTDPDLRSYSIYRKNLTDTAEDFKKLNANPLERSLFKYIDRSAEEGTAYEYYLEATDSSLNTSRPSNRNRGKIKITREDDNIKIASFEVNYNGKHHKVELKWKVKGDENIKGYVVYKIKPGETGFIPITGTLEDTKLSDTDIIKENNYSYQLRVYNLKGDVYRSEKITVYIN